MSEPAATITIMFTDLVGSTALTNRLGEDQSQALRRAHERILTRQFQRHAGEVIKGTGDGFMVAFASAREAVECAIDVQRAIEHEHAEGRYEDLSVRIGVHTGEPVRERGDLFGRDVNLAARIEAEADGGGVLVSEVTWLLTRESARLAYTAIGERSLKGFDEPMPLFAARGTAEAARPRRTRFVGRAEEAAQLRAALDAACRGHGGVAFVTGDAGIGKTRLVAELAIAAKDRGMDVVSGVAYEADALPPFLPIIEALRGHFAAEGTSVTLEREDMAYLARLLPELAPAGASAGAATGLDPESERELLFGAINAVFRGMAERRPLLLTLDDLHWADQSTLLLLRHIAQQIPDIAMLIVATYRDVEVDKRHPLRPVLTDLARGRLAQHISLRPFARDETGALIEATIGAQPAPRVVDALLAATEGNAFYTEELARQLHGQGHDLTDPNAEVGDWGIPDGVRQLITRRLARLDADAHQLLSHASVIGRDLSLAVVAAVTGGDEMAVLDGMDVALEMGLLRDTDAGYAFAHPLIRATLYDELSAERRRILHRRAGVALESIFARDLDAHVADLALHFYNAGPHGDPAKTVDYACRAGAAAEGVFAYEDAAGHYERALEVFESRMPSDELAHSDLLLHLGEARWKMGAMADMRTAFRGAADAARAADAPDRLARAALGFGSGEQDFVGEDAELIALLREALERLGDDAMQLRAMVLARLAPALMTSADREEARATSAAAVDAARRADDPATLVRALNARHEALLHPDELAERLELGTQAVALVEGSGDKVAAWYTHDWRLIDLLEVGDAPGARDQLQRLYAIAEELRQPQWLGLTNVAATALSLLAGKFGEAEARIAEARATAERHAAVSLGFYSDLQLFALRREQGRLDETEDIIERWVTGQPNIGRVARLQAPRYAELGAEAHARESFEVVAADDFAKVPPDNVWLYTMCMLSDVCAFLADARRGDVLYRLLLPYAARYASLGDVHWAGSVARFVAKAAAASGRCEEARQHFSHGIEQDARVGATPFVGYGEYELGGLLLRMGDGSGAERIARAAAIAGELGMGALQAKVRRAPVA